MIQKTPISVQAREQFSLPGKCFAFVLQEADRYTRAQNPKKDKGLSCCRLVPVCTIKMDVASWNGESKTWTWPPFSFLGARTYLIWVKSWYIKLPAKASRVGLQETFINCTVTHIGQLVLTCALKAIKRKNTSKSLILTWEPQFEASWPVGYVHLFVTVSWWQTITHRHSHCDAVGQSHLGFLESNVMFEWVFHHI